MKLNQLLILFEEIVEKILRMECLLKEVGHLSLKPDRELLKFFRGQLNGLKQMIMVPIEEILKNKNRLDEKLIRKHLVSYFVVFDYFHTFHQQVDFFVSFPQIQNEVYTTIHSLFPEEDYKVIAPTIVYYYNYNFAEFNASHYFQKIGILVEESIKDRVVLLLPYVDFKNPLMWVALIHEMGHALEKDFKISEKILALLNRKQGHKEAEVELLENWCKEFCADIIALKLVGPAYLNSYISFLLSRHPERHTPSSTHPQPHDRIDLMYSCLENRQLESAKTYYELFCSLTTFFGTERLDPCVKHSNIECPKLIVPLSDLTGKVKDSICKLPFKKIYNETAHEISCELANLLSKDLPVSSYREKPSSEIRKKLKLLLEEVHKNKTEITHDETYPLLELVEEQYSDVSQILNAAWIQKTDNCPHVFKQIFGKVMDEKNSERDTQIKFDEFAKYLDFYDCHVQKSIEVSKIHSIFRPEKKR